jgi:hypothetical protein
MTAMLLADSFLDAFTCSLITAVSSLCRGE